MKFEPAACIIVPTGNTIEEIFAISRRNNPNMWGVPGGKQDPGESNVDCARREILEELGIDLDAESLIPLYSGPCYGKDGRDFWVTTYLLNEISGGSLLNSPEEGLLVRPMEIISLCNDTVSPFAHYNQHLVTAWRTLR